MPFGYGNAHLTAAPILFLRVQIETGDGKHAHGLAADSLPPRWFDKDPSRTYRRNVADQLAAFEKAREIYMILGHSARTAADLWLEAYPRILDEGAVSSLNPLTLSFGSSFFERAILDALCRSRGIPFFDALKQDLLGLQVSKSLPAKPLRSIACRHTVGLEDPITVAEISPDRRLDDGLPQALEEDIEFYGLHHFKVKVNNDHDRDLDRLGRMAALFSQRCRRGYKVTLDGNEQYGNVAGIEKLLDALGSKPYGKQLLDSILFVEQPLPRDIALSPDIAPDIEKLAELKPVTIDESDDQLDSFERAVKLGYSGVSHKNCKGVFKSLQNRVFVARLNKETGDSRYFQTGEDLTNLPVVSLHEDFAVLAALGIDHAERNGHHYYRGLDHLLPGEASSALAAHPDMYEERQGSVFLKVQDGAMVIDSIQTPGFGYGAEVAFEERIPLVEWSFDRLGVSP
jgi:hypothetical protein